MRDGRKEEAIAEARKAVQLDPEDPRSHLLLGFCLEKAGRHAEAVEPLRRAHLLQPNDPAVWLMLATALERSGRLGEALAEYRRVAARWAGQPPARAALQRIRTIQRKLDQRQT